MTATSYSMTNTWWTPVKMVAVHSFHRTLTATLWGGENDRGHPIGAPGDIMQLPYQNALSMNGQTRGRRFVHFLCRYCLVHEL